LQKKAKQALALYENKQIGLETPESLLQAHYLLEQSRAWNARIFNANRPFLFR